LFLATCPSNKLPPQASRHQLSFEDKDWPRVTTERWETQTSIKVAGYFSMENLMDELTHGILEKFQSLLRDMC